jgi:hypothetical protein
MGCCCDREQDIKSSYNLSYHKSKPDLPIISLPHAMYSTELAEPEIMVPRKLPEERIPRSDSIQVSIADSSFSMLHSTQITPDLNWKMSDNRSDTASIERRPFGSGEENCKEWVEWIRAKSTQELVKCARDESSCSPVQFQAGWGRSVNTVGCLALGRLVEISRKVKEDWEEIDGSELISMLKENVISGDGEKRFWSLLLIMYLFKNHRVQLIDTISDPSLLSKFKHLLISSDEETRCIISRILRYFLQSTPDAHFSILEYEDFIFPHLLIQITQDFKSTIFLCSHLLTIQILLLNSDYTIPNYSDFLSSISQKLSRMPDCSKYSERISKILADLKDRYEDIKKHTSSR